MLRTRATTESDKQDVKKLKELSYSKQYDTLFQSPLNPKRAVPKPSFEAQTKEPDGKRVLLSNVVATKKRTLFNREWNQTDLGYLAFILGMHVLALGAPFTYSGKMLIWFLAAYFVTGCLGITLSYHRQLSHRSFTTPKWLEYALAYCGVLAGQGDPLEWVSSHRQDSMGDNIDPSRLCLGITMCTRIRRWIHTRRTKASSGVIWDGCWTIK